MSRLTPVAEHAALPEPPVFAVHTAVEIEAPPEVVWRHVVSFSELPPPTEFLFRMGIAYPIKAEIYGEGVGAERHCVFSTGSFVEPIEVWDEPRLLNWRLWSDGIIHTIHLCVLRHIKGNVEEA